MSKRTKPYQEMNADELAEATKMFDDPNYKPKYLKYTPKERAQMERIEKRLRRAVGRPKVGEGIKRVMVSVEQGLLNRADRYARRQKITRAQLIARGLETIIGKAS